MPWVEFEPTIPGLERATTVHALERAAVVIGLGVEERGRNIITNVQEAECEGLDCMQLPRYMVQLRAFMYTIMDICFPQKAGNFLTR
jgi:hypothetical protein